MSLPPPYPLKVIQDFLMEKADEGALPGDEYDELLELMVTAQNAHISIDCEDGDPSIPAISKQIAHEMEVRMLELQPRLRDEWNKVKGGGRGRES
jgi:hypothetical protein